MVDDYFNPCESKENHTMKVFIFAELWPQYRNRPSLPSRPVSHTPRNHEYCSTTTTIRNMSIPVAPQDNKKPCKESYLIVKGSCYYYTITVSLEYQMPPL